MKSKIFLALFALFAVSANALESITCSEKLDADGNVAGKTDLGLGTEHDGSGRASDWTLTVNGKTVKISSFKLGKTEADPTYQITALIDSEARVGVAYDFHMDGCDESKARMDKKNIGGFAGGAVVQKLQCSCSID